MQSPVRSIALAVLAVPAAIVAALAAGCASRPADAARSAERPSPAVALVAMPVRLLDQNRALLRLEARISNPRSEALAVAAAECAIAIEGSPTPLAAAQAGGIGSPIAAGGESAVAFEREIDIRSLDWSVRGPDGPPEASWSAAARVILRAPDGSEIEAVAAARGAVPIVREPILRITSLRIERDVLVTTNLRLGLELLNPNAFPLEMRSISYDFYGEGKVWASDGDGSAAAIPAKGRIERGLRFTMNFADVDRRLFDLVSKLRAVRYRLAGTALVGTGLEAIPSFELGFDLEGSCPVEE